jgi:uncharacterized protein YfaS (alpha-2-macroglobulin family)
MKHLRTFLIGLVLVTALSLSACSLFKRPNPAPTATPAPPASTATPLPTSTPTVEPTALPPRPVIGYTPVPSDTVSPIVVQRFPESGQEFTPDGGIQLVFDRAMNQSAVESAFAIQPAVAGKFAWADPRTLVFKPDQPLARDALYDVVLKQTALAADGAPLRSAYQFRFATAGYLEVGQVIPAPGATDVEAGSRITVIFNRPVVPLTSLDQQANFPQPLVLDPAVRGHGQWLNTSIYVFQPDEPLVGGMAYTAKVSGVKDTDGNPMSGDYSWRFTTQPPKVVWVSPANDSQQVRIESAVRVQFNQPVDSSSAQQAFSLRVAGKAVPGMFDIFSNTLTFTPTARLPFDAQAEGRVAAGVKSKAAANAAAAGMPADYAWSFKTVPLPRIVRTEPANGNRNASPYTSFTIYFNTPIDPATVMPNLQMSPPLSPTQVYTSSWGEGFSLSFGAQPSTDYVVQLGPNIADPYGNVTGQSLTVRFRTGDIAPDLRLHVPNFVGTYSAYAPARLYASYVNVKRVDLKLYRLTPEDLVQFNSRDWYTNDPPPSALMRQWSQALEAPLNKVSYAPIDAQEGGGPLAPGVYLLVASSPSLKDNNYGLRHLMVVSKVNLTLKAFQDGALIWATDLQSGQPMPDLNVNLYDSQARQIGAATTGSDGVAQVALEGSQRDLSMVSAVEPFAFVLNGWNSGISPWDFQLQAEYGLSPYRAHIYTDRPIYRPGQTVYFRGIVRAEDDVVYALPTGQAKVHVNILSPKGEQVFAGDLALDDYGTFNGQAKLAEGAALGPYNLQADLIPVRYSEPSPASFQATFQVAAYRPPEFEVVVTPEQDQIVRGVTVPITAQVKYFFGGAVTGVPVQWNVLADTYDFRPAWGGNYSFRDTDDPWECFDCWWFQRESPRRVVLSGSGVTDENGNLKFEISDLKFQTPMTGTLDLIVEATATGNDNQVISGRSEITAHRGDYYVGVAAEKYVGKEGEPFGVNLVAVDWRGDNPRIPSKTLKVEIYRREWKNTFIRDEAGGGRWQSETNDTLVDTQSVTTNDRGEASLSFIPPQGGSYRVLAMDANSPLAVRSSLFVWVTGKEYVSWWRENNDRINLIADKVSYLPGETAEILIPSPYQGPHVALVTVERGGVLKHEVIQMTSNSQVYRLPLTAGYAPNIYVSVVLVKGGGLPSPSGRGEGGEGTADYKVGIVPLEVKPTAQTLSITLTSDPAQGEPGKSVIYMLHATDAAGQPVQAAFSLDLVDKAVLSLMPRQKNAVVEEFYGRRGLGVQTSSGLAVSVNRMLLEVEKDLGMRAEVMKAGAGAVPMGTQAPAMLEAPPMPAARQATADSSAGVPAIPANIQIRQEFADTAYWNASVVTDRDGKATVNVKLPDNLTTWVMRGVGVTVNTNVGEATADLVSTKPLLIRPVTPRFFVVGDKSQLAAVVNNNTDSPLQAMVVLSATGVTLSSSAAQTTTIPARGESKLTWNVVVQDVTQTDLVFWAVAEQYNDASKPRLATGPDGSLLVYRYSAPDIVGTAGDLASAGGRTEVIALPPQYDDRQGELSVQLDPSLAAAMQDGLSYLEHYEYECAEQTVSRFLPNVLTYRALKELGLSDPELEKKLPDLVKQGLDKLYNQQRKDGGWGWWSDSQDSNVNLTAYVVFALIKAQQSGFEVQGDVLQRGQQFLVSKLVSVRDLTSFGTANRQAFVLYVLAEGNAKSQITNIKSQLGDLFDNRDKLSHYGRAYLALALWLGNSTDTRIATLLSDLNNAAILSATGAHWEEANYDWWAMNTDTRSTAIILDALARLDKNNQLAPNVVRWLMVARKGGYWETTQETAWALIGLTDWMKATGELAGNYDYAVFLNDKDRAHGQVTKDSVRESIKLRVDVAELLKESNRLTISRGDGQGRLYYTAHLRVFLPVQDIKPVSRGITVNRRYTLASCTDGPKCPEVKEAKLGDVIRVDLTLIAPNDLYYVVVEDPLPAGGEAIDTGLATTSLLDQGPALTRQVEGRHSHYWWWWHWYSRSELRDEKVVLFADYLTKGTYEYSYTFRATLPGDYQVIPTVAREFYFPEVFGRSDGRLLSIGQ